MAWQNGGPGSKIPERIKRHVRAQQHGHCNTINPTVCTGAIDEFDHIHNVKALGIDRGEANDPDNIQGLCTPCHQAKTQAEAQAARTRRSGRRKPRPHPADTLKNWL